MVDHPAAREKNYIDLKFIQLFQLRQTFLCYCVFSVT